MNINLLELWSEMGIPVRVVVVVLTLQAIASLAVAVDRLVLLFRSRAVSTRFAADAARPLDEGDFVRVRELASRAQGSHLALVMFAGLDVFLKRSDAGDSTERAADLARRAIERKGESLSTSLHQGMGVLASTGSTAPFVGMAAFQAIANSQNTSLNVVAPGIAEALFATAIGLVAAIPATIFYNMFSSDAGKIGARLENFADEFSAIISRQLDERV